AMIPPTTTNNATGLFLRKIFPSTSNASAMPPIVSEVELVSFRCFRKLLLFTQKFPWAPWMPNNLGNWVLARKSATPHLNPTITLSEMKLTIEPALTSQAVKAMHATSTAVPAARALNRLVSPPAIPPNEAPVSSEIADVTVMVVCRELQNSQKTSPPNKHAYSPASGGRLGSDASPSPAGKRYAASVRPATRSARNQAGL